MKIIDGKKVSNEVLDEIKLAVLNRKKLNLKIPHLAAVLVGDDGPSQTYVNSKIRACERVCFEYSLFQIDKSITEHELIYEI
jgi:methylenetetrahydrofolate dehydrogenase (NADP+)/methenyltetrahydrofolate cyclohydrolase